MKRLVDASEQFAIDAFRGFIARHEDRLVADIPHRFVRRRVKAGGKVKLISGGGGGHEPMHLGFVGTGMLDAACVGNVFTSPTPGQIVAAADAVGGEEGILLIVKQYAGDVMNFQVACDQIRLPVRTLIVNDDVAASAAPNQRRGLAGAVLVHKLLGAAAEQGATLEQLDGMGQEIVAHTATVGVALAGCTSPFTGLPNFELGPSEFEFGVGIHGELGARRMTAEGVDEIIRLMLDTVRAGRTKSRDAIVLLNNLGGVGKSEMNYVFFRMREILPSFGLRGARLLCGAFATSLDTYGFSITVSSVLDRTLDLWDAPVDTPALRWNRRRLSL